MRVSERVGALGEAPRRWWLIGSASALIVGVVLAALEVTPWPLVLVALGLSALVVGQWSSWPFAFAAAVVTLVVVFALLVRVTPWLGLGLDAAGLLALVAVGLSALAVIGWRAGLRLPTARNAVFAVPAVVVTAAAGIAGFALVAAGNLAWAMNNDAVWNLVTTRVLADDGGLRPELHPNSSPLTTSLLATAISAGRSAVEPGELLRHDVTRAAELWIVLLAMSVALAALIALRSTREAPTWLRWVAVVVTGLLPASWYVFGWAAFFGFYNATIVIVVLLASWLAWLESRSAPILGSATLGLATVALLATWAPVAAIPAGLAVAALLWQLRGGTRGFRRTSLWWLLVMLPVPIYVAFVTLSDLARDGGALVANGGIVDLSKTELASTVLVASIVVAGFAIATRAFHLLVGYVVVVLTLLLGVGYLVVQRLQGGAAAWGYYPIKMAWLSSGLVVVILVATAFAALALVPGSRRVVLTVGVVTVAVLGGAFVPNPPIARPLIVNAAILTNPLVQPLSAGSEAAGVIFDLARPGQRVMAARLTDPVTDRNANAWLLQLNSTFADDPIRRYAYYLDPESPAEICDAVGAWTGEVTIHTSDPALEDSLRQTCPDADIEVVVHGG